MATPSAVLWARTVTWARSGIVQRGVVYRSLDRLLDLGLIRSAGEEPSHAGPGPLPGRGHRAGQAAAASWQHRPVQHTRDIRSELLVKLALLHRSGTDPHDLLVAQRAQLVPIADALRDRIAAATGFDRTLLLWRYETASATIRFPGRPGAEPAPAAGAETQPPAG